MLPPIASSTSHINLIAQLLKSRILFDGGNDFLSIKGNLNTKIVSLQICSMIYLLPWVKDRVLLELDIDAVWKKSIVLSLQGIGFLLNST